MINFIIWIVFGALAGWIASLIMKTDASQGTVFDILLGIVGSIVGGYLMQFFGQSGVTGFNIYSLVVAVIGACALIFLGRLLR